MKKRTTVTINSPVLRMPEEPRYRKCGPDMPEPGDAAMRSVPGGTESIRTGEENVRTDTERPSSACLFPSPLGVLLLRERDGFLTECAFLEEEEAAESAIPVARTSAEAPTPLLRRTWDQLAEYFAGQRKELTCPWPRKAPRSSMPSGRNSWRSPMASPPPTGRSPLPPATPKRPRLWAVPTAGIPSASSSPATVSSAAAGNSPAMPSGWSGRRSCWSWRRIRAARNPRQKNSENLKEKREKEKQKRSP